MTTRQSILSIPSELFAKYPIVVAGDLINPTFLLSSINAIVGVNMIDDTYINEISLYNYLEMVGNEHSCDLFCYIVERLNWCRYVAAGEVENIHVCALSFDIKLRIRMSNLIFRKYKSNINSDELDELKSMMGKLVL